MVHTSGVKDLYETAKSQCDTWDCIRHHSIRGANNNKRAEYFPVAIEIDPPPNQVLKIAPTTIDPNPFIMDIPILNMDCKLHSPL